MAEGNIPLGDYDSKALMDARAEDSRGPDPAAAVPGGMSALEVEAIAKMQKAQQAHEAARASTTQVASLDEIARAEEVVKAGYLIKAPPKLSRMAAWKTRWFVLKRGSGVVPYYADAEAAAQGQRPKGTIDLNVCDTVDRYTGPSKQDHVLQLKSNDRNFLLAAPDQPSYDLWFDEFTKTKSRLFTRKGGYSVFIDNPSDSDDEIVEVPDSVPETSLPDLPVPPAAEPEAAAAPPRPSPYRIADKQASVDSMREEFPEYGEVVLPARASVGVDDSAWFGVAKPGVPPPVTASDKRAAPPPPAEPEEAVAAAPAAPASAPAPVVAKRAAPAPPAEEVPVIAKRAAPATPTEEVPNYENEEHTTKPWFFGVMSRAEAEATLREATSSAVCGGLFLVRQSDRGIGFAMSWIGGHKGTITHTKVSKLGNGSFKFDSSHGPAPQVSLSVLIECQEFRDMLRRAHESFQQDANEALTRARAKNKTVAAPSADIDDNDDDFYIMHTPLKLSGASGSTSSSKSSTEAEKMKQENDKLRGELLEAQAWLAHSREGGGDAPVAPTLPAAGAVSKQYMHHVPLKKKEGVIKAPLSEVDLVAQVQQDLVDRLEMTYAAISSQGSLRDRVNTDHDI